MNCQLLHDLITYIRVVQELVGCMSQYTLSTEKGEENGILYPLSPHSRLRHPRRFPPPQKKNGAEKKAENYVTPH